MKFTWILGYNIFNSFFSELIKKKKKRSLIYSLSKKNSTQVAFDDSLPGFNIYVLNSCCLLMFKVCLKMMELIPELIESFI